MRSDSKAARKPHHAAIKKAAGGGLISVASASLINGIKILEGGSFSFDNSLHLQLSDATNNREPGTVDKSAAFTGNFGLRCDTHWNVGPFANGHSDKLDGGASLDASIDSAAKAIHQNAPGGTVLLLGSGDSQQHRYENVNLANNRAGTVATRLDTALRKLDPGTQQEVVSVNTALLGNGSTYGSSEIDKGLARLLFGRDESSARTVISCVMAPPTQFAAKPGNTSTVAGLSGGNHSFLEGMVVGMIVANAIGVAVLLAGTMLAVVFALKWLGKTNRDKLDKKPRKSTGTAATNRWLAARQNKSKPK